MLTKRQEFTQFTREERSLIYQMRSDGKRLREIGERLGRGANAAGSISRELERNRHLFPAVQRARSPLERAAYAHEKTLERRKLPRKREKLEVRPELRARVISLLVDEQAAPRDIAYRVVDELPGEKIAYTTIYNFTKYRRPDLKQYLRLRGKVRKQRVANRRSRFREGAPPKTNISLRPARVQDHIEFGHYEADTIHSCKGGSGAAILSLRELKSRMRWYFFITALKAEIVLAVLQGFFRNLPPHMQRTLTVDNGPENEHLYKLEHVFPGFKVYFCDPYSAWQRGSIENANGEFRWYHPKGIDFENVSPEEIWRTQDKLNRRRMCCLGGKSAQHVYEHALKHPPLIQLASADVLRSQAALYRETGFSSSLTHRGENGQQKNSAVIESPHGLVTVQSISFSHRLKDESEIGPPKYFSLQLKYDPYFFSRL